MAKAKVSQSAISRVYIKIYYKQKILVLKQLLMKEEGNLSSTMDVESVIELRLFLLLESLMNLYDFIQIYYIFLQTFH